MHFHKFLTSINRQAAALPKQASHWPLIYTCALVLFFAQGHSHAQSIENIRAEEMDDGRVAILFDIIGEIEFDVSVFCSAFPDKPLRQVSGDVGPNTRGGPGKRIVWDILNEISFLPPDVYFEIRARYKTIDLNWMYVEGGTFTMGSMTGPRDEQPLHSVQVSDFYITTHEITVAEYRKFCQTTGRRMPSQTPEWGWDENNPIVYVSWFDAQAFSEWAGGRLPTEAEWEFAAKGGTKTRNTEYSGSNQSMVVAWHDVNAKSQSQPVGLKPANELELYDMSGNVSEWCADWFDKEYYKKSPKSNPKGPAKGERKTLRGGSFLDFAFSNRVTKRMSLTPGTKSKDVGFRVVKDIEN